MSDSEVATGHEDEEQYKFESRVEWLESATEHVDAPAIELAGADEGQEAWA
jgi:hypothetical protein